MKRHNLPPEYVKHFLTSQIATVLLPMAPQPSPEAAVVDPYDGSYRHFTAWTQDHRMITRGGNKPGEAHWCCPLGDPGRLVKLGEGAHIYVRKWRSDGKLNGTIRYDDEGYARTVAYYADQTPELLADLGSEDRFWHFDKLPWWALRMVRQIRSITCRRVRDLSDEEIFSTGWSLRKTPNERADFDRRVRCVVARRAGIEDENAWAWVVELEKVA